MLRGVKITCEKALWLEGAQPIQEARFLCLEQGQQQKPGEIFWGQATNQEGLKEQGEESGLFSEGNREPLIRFIRGGNKTRPTLLKGHSAIQRAECTGRGRRHQARKQWQSRGQACP